ncbi:MAG TPA: glycerol-3-phosphate dehydrogenase/oxidase [Aeromicrobium sp.]|nr:glycerol-3-phosphate dehydrogenase/oxidase [Aeromicrobium sp.]
MTTDSARIHAGLGGIATSVDVLVVGLGITGAGVALDAAARGLSVLAVDAHDVAFGTSRWSSKLVHGGLRYLATGQLGIAYESAKERAILIDTTAPHLVRPLGSLIPLTEDISTRNALLSSLGIRAGDALRIAARTPRRTLPPPRRISAAEARRLAPGIKADGLRGALLYWDGQAEDDARLVTCIARTAAAHGAVVRTRARVLSATGTSAVLRDEVTGGEVEIAARAVINATGVWADTLAEDIRLRPSRGTHLVLRADRLGRPRTTVNVPVPGSGSRWVFAIPQSDGTVFVGLTDEPAADVPDVPQPSEEEVDFLLTVMSRGLEMPLTRADIVGTFAGLRPLLDAHGSTEDLSRKHAVHTSPSGVITIVGGKLTTYRRMAEDAVDATGLTDKPSPTAHLPLLGAANRSVLAAVQAPERLVRRFGTEAPAVLASAVTTSGLTEDELVAPGPRGVTLAELIFGVTHEGAADVEDLLDRRTRIGLIPADREAAIPWAHRALTLTRS